MSFIPAPKSRVRSVSFQRQAPLSLNFLIIGAGTLQFSHILDASVDTYQGISGLACAYSLASSGHRVTILEALPEDAPKSYSGLRVPPNVSKILLEWGLGEELKMKTRPCRKAAFDDRGSSSCFHVYPRVRHSTPAPYSFSSFAFRALCLAAP